MPRNRGRNKMMTLMKQAEALPLELCENLYQELRHQPGDVYLLASTTPHQKMLWRQSKGFFQRVGAVLQTRFTGEAPPIYVGLGLHERNEIENEVARYFTFYGMIAANWDAVRCGLLKSEQPPAVADAVLTPNMTHYAELDTPGKVLLEAIRYRAIGHMDAAFKSAPVKQSPYEVRQRFASKNKAIRSDASAITQVQHSETVTDHLAAKPWACFELICLLAAQNGRPKPKDSAKRAITNYVKELEAEGSFIAKINHKQNKAKGFRWEGGFQSSL